VTTRPRLAAACAVVLALAAAVLLPATASAKTAVTDCGPYYNAFYKTWWPYQPLATVKPTRFTYDCQIRWQAKISTWKTYRAKKAVAKGSVRWFNNPKNAIPGEITYKKAKGVRFTFTRPRRMQQDQPVRVFTRLSVHHPKLGKRAKGRFKLKLGGPFEGQSCVLGFSRRLPYSSTVCPRIAVP